MKNLSKSQKREVKILLGILFSVILLVVFHLSYWAWYYSVANPTWNRVKCNDMAYEHFLDLTDWP